MITLTKQWAEDSVYLWNFRNTLTKTEQPYFDWWVDYLLTKKRRRNKQDPHDADYMFAPSMIPPGYVQGYNKAEKVWKITRSDFGERDRYGIIEPGIKNNYSSMDDKEVVKPDVDEDTTITPEEEVEAMHEDVKKGMEEASEVSHAKDDKEESE